MSIAGAVGRRATPMAQRSWAACGSRPEGVVPRLVGDDAVTGTSQEGIGGEAGAEAVRAVPGGNEHVGLIRACCQVAASDWWLPVLNLRDFEQSTCV